VSLRIHRSCHSVLVHPACPILAVLFSLTLPPPPTSTLLPYTTLFRSAPSSCYQHRHTCGDRRMRPAPLLLALLVLWGLLGIAVADRKSTRLNSSHVKISYAVFCLKKKKKN